MDFQTIKNNCLCLRYSTPDEFLRDVALVFNNAAGYNKVIYHNQIYTKMLVDTCEGQHLLYTSVAPNSVAWLLLFTGVGSIHSWAHC